MRVLLIIALLIVVSYVFGQQTKISIIPIITSQADTIIDIKPFNESEKNLYLQKINDVDFTKASPLEYLRYITSFKDSTWSNSSEFGILSFQIYFDTLKLTNKKWVTRNDIEILIKFIDSKQFCKCIYFSDEDSCSQECNYYVGESTLGIEVMRIIDTFKSGRFFYGCSAMFSRRNNQDSLAEDFRKWYQKIDN